jgi:hypothetical protein
VGNQNRQQGNQGGAATQDPPKSEPVNSVEPTGGGTDAPPSHPHPADVQGQSSVGGPVKNEPKASVPPAPEQPRRPSQLQMDLLKHGKLNGRERTDDLQRLKAKHGEVNVDTAIESLIENGLLDRGQVLTEKGDAALLKYSINE